MSGISIFCFPLSLILAAAFAAGVFVMVRFAGRSRLCSLLSDRRFAAGLSFAVTVLIALEGTFALDIHRSIPFIALCFLLMLSLAAALSRDISARRPLGAALCHGGLLLIIFGAMFGAPDFQRGRMRVEKNSGVNVALGADGRDVPLPFSVSLEEFRIDYYRDGVSPKQFTSDLLVDGAPKSASVNNPCYHRGWFIYQSGYDRADMDSTVLEVVRDPFLPLVFIGMLALALGALLSVRNVWKSGYVLVAALALTVVFTLVSLARISLGTLMPALRSFWFVPHLAAYMLAYSFLAISLILGTFSLVSKKADRVWALSGRFLQTSSSLLLLGMLCGAVWAKFAWGDYWTWDPKECWAAATSLLTLCATHLPLPKAGGRKFTVILILISFLSMQVTWYGVNYLPSAGSSVHTYNVK